jgi:diguanylate cyclase (GGDEF)-like protein/PAS domain S-box-containing protein
MKRILSQPLLFGGAYFVAAALPVLATRLEGGVALLWVASALLTAKLRSTRKGAWGPWLFSAAVASTLVTGLFGLGWVAAPAMMAFNLVDAILAERVLHTIEQRRGAISLERDGLLLVLACFVGALATALPAAAVTHWVTGTPALANGWNWIISHTLGSLAFGPFMTLWMRGKMRPWLASLIKGRDLHVLGLVITLAATAAVAFSHSTFTFLFLPVLALVILSYRTGLPGTAFGNVMLALIGTLSLLLGNGSEEFGGQAATFQFLLFFLGMTILVMLPVSAVVSARWDMVRKLRASEDGYRMLADNIEDVVISCDAKGRLTYASPSIRNFAGELPEQVLGKRALELIEPRFHEAAHAALRKMIANRGRPVTFEFVGIASGDQDRWFEMRGRAVKKSQADAVCVIGTIRETTQRKRLASALASAAETDALTGLLNRRAFLSAAKSASTHGASNWLALFDLDHVNAINTFIGDDAGDLVLKTFASVTKRSVRDGDLIGRLEDDAFGVLLLDCSAEAAERICQRVLAAFAGARITYVDRPIAVSASAGLASLDDDLEESMRAARSALSRSKTAGGAKLSLAA